MSQKLQNTSEHLQESKPASVKGRGREGKEREGGGGEGGGRGRGEREGGERRIIGRMEAVPIFKRHHQHSFIIEFHDFAGVIQSYYSETGGPQWY